MSEQNPREYVGINPGGNSNALINVLIPEDFYALKGSRLIADVVHLVDKRDYDALLAENEQLVFEKLGPAAEIGKLRRELKELMVDNSSLIEVSATLLAENEKESATVDYLTKEIKAQHEELCQLRTAKRELLEALKKYSYEQHHGFTAREALKKWGGE